MKFTYYDEGEINAWGTYWNYDYYYNTPNDYIGKAIDLEAFSGGALLRTLAAKCEFGELQFLG